MAKICVAGKNDIAIYGLKLIMDKVNRQDIVCIPNLTDTGYDTWQPSFQKFVKQNNLNLVELDQIYETPNLIFLSLEFDRLIRPKKFVSSNLYNIHFSKLPSYKGMFTSAHPILNNEKTTGVTLHKIDPGIDTGDIIDQIEFEIPSIVTSRQLYKSYLENSKKLVKRNLKNLLTGQITAEPQSNFNSSYYSRNSINYKNLKLNLFKTAFEVQNQVKAFYFPEYQVPRFLGAPLQKCEILDTKSFEVPGTKMGENEYELIVTTIDYDVKFIKDQNTILLDACKNDDIVLMKSAIRYGANIEYRAPQGWKPIHIASYNGALSCIDYLLKSKAI